MQSSTLAALLLALCSAAAAGRFKRQFGGFNNAPPVHGTNSDPALEGLFPFVHRYSNNMQIEPGDDVIVDGDVNVAVQDWGLVDIPIKWRSGRTPIDINYGWLVAPVNQHDVNPTAVLHQQTQADTQATQAGFDPVPVIRLPGDFAPLACRPPVCNPFVHSTAVGVDVNANLNPYLDAGFDFPIPLDIYGSHVRFPLSGGFVKEQSGVNVQFGHELSPSDRLYRRYERQQQKNADEAFAQWIKDTTALLKPSAKPKP